MKKLIASTLVSIGLIAATATLVTAQTANPPQTPGARTHDGMRQHAQREFGLPSERVEARLTYIKGALNITDAQQAQWDAFANTMRKQAANLDKRIQEARSSAQQGGGSQRLTAVARLEREQQWLAAALDNLNERLAVERPLYAVLAADQQQIADKLLAPRRPGNFRHRRA